MADRDEFESLPEPVRRRLDERYRLSVHVPPGVDRRVLEAARHHFAGQRRRRRWWWAAGPAAAAAAVALALWVVDPFASSAPPTQVAQRRALPGDVDQSGRVDILDALALARRIEADDPPAGADINGDGRVDRADVDAIGTRIVALDEREEPRS